EKKDEGASAATTTAALETVLGKDFKTSFETLKTTVTELQSKGQNAVALAKRSEIDALVAEASRDGKKIPYENDDLYTVKDGSVTIHTEPAMLRKVISKLEKTVQTGKRTTFTAPKNKDGAELKGVDLIAFNRDRRM